MPVLVATPTLGDLLKYELNAGYCRETVILKGGTGYPLGAAQPTQIYIQAGAFGVYENAHRVQAVLAPLGSVKISPILVNGRDLFRVRLGPLADVAQADRLLDSVIQAGYPGARVTVD